MRARILEVLGHVVHGRITMEALQAGIMVDLQQGMELLAFGTYWTKQHMDVLYAAGLAIEAAFHMLKWLQAPGTPGRLDDALAALDQIRPALAASRKAMAQTAMNASTPTKMLTDSETQYPAHRLRRSTG